jgi:hypothetical protein
VLTLVKSLVQLAQVVPFRFERAEAAIEPGSLLLEHLGLLLLCKILLHLLDGCRLYRQPLPQLLAALQPGINFAVCLPGLGQDRTGLLLQVLDELVLLVEQLLF